MARNEQPATTRCDCGRLAACDPQPGGYEFAVVCLFCGHVRTISWNHASPPPTFCAAPPRLEPQPARLPFC